MQAQTDQFFIGRTVMVVVLSVTAAAGFVLMVVSHWMAPVRARRLDPWRRRIQ